MDWSATPEVLNAFLESIGDAVYVVGAEGEVVFANHVTLDLLGYDQAELIGRPSHATIHYKRPDGGPFPESECPLLRPRMTGEAVRVDDDWVVRRDGSVLPVAYTSAPVATPMGRGAVVVFRDMRPRLELEEVRAREALERGRAEEVRASRARIIAATDAERRRLARDLHDGAQRRLVNVGIQLQMLAASDAARAGAIEPNLRELIRDVEDALDELRDFAHGLHPPVLSRRGLGPALAALVERSPIPVALDVRVSGRLAESVEIAAYYLVSEMLTNAVKHAKASRVQVTAEPLNGVLRICVRDDGVGGADPGGGGSGLTGLRDRVAALSGGIAIDSPQGGGTTVVAELPLST